MALKKLFYTKVGKDLTVEVWEIQHDRRGSDKSYEIGCGGMWQKAEIVDSFEKAMEIHNDWVRTATILRELKEELRGLEE